MGSTELFSQDLETPTFQICEELKPPHKPESMNLALDIEVHRLITFPMYWNISTSMKQLARSGFFVTEELNSVQCYFCKLQVTDKFDWNYLGVDASIKHHALNPACPLMLAEETSNIPITDTTNYRYEALRLHSFFSTTWFYPVTPFDLAKQGFYWTGSTDNCCCAFCQLEVRVWENGETAEGQHRRWNPHCMFINGREVGNVPIGMETSTDANGSDEAGMIAYQSNTNPFKIDQVSKYGQIVYSNIIGPRPTVETLGVTPINIPKYPEYMLLESRINSYKTWSIALPQKPYSLAEAGFYYIGISDRVICFQCGGGIKDWDPTDTPWCSHAKWFPSCSYLLVKKGKDYVDEVLKDHQVEISIDISKKVFALQEEPQLTVQELITSQESAEPANLKCHICNEKYIETVYLPCRHMVSCMGCINKEIICRKCMKLRVAYIKIFLQ